MRKLLQTAILGLGLSLTGTGCLGQQKVASHQAQQPARDSQALRNQAPKPGKLQIFSLSELKKFNGRNGKPVYIAVNGIVYDVTGAPWRDALRLLKKYKVVGKLKQ